MKGNGISTSDEVQTLLAGFGGKHNINAWLARDFGTTWEHVAGCKTREDRPRWRIAIDDQFSIILESHDFPDNLVGELVDLAESLRKAIHAMGI